MARSLDQLPPEILMTIFDDMNMEELSTVMLVNRQWFHLAIRRFWQEQDNNYLAKVPKGRRGLYTPWIQHLDLTGSPKELYEEYKDFKFSKVKGLSVELENDQASIADCRYLTHFMNPDLQGLYLSGSITADLLRDVQTRCPRLETVTLWAPGPSVTPTDFLTFLRGLPYVDVLKIWEADGHTILDSKAIEEFVATTQQDASSDEPLFPEMKQIDITLRHDAVASMVKIFRHLFVLDLRLRGAPSGNRWEKRVRSDALRPLSELTQIRCLEILVQGNMSIIPGDLVALRSLSSLTCLKIEREKYDKPNVPAPNFNDDDLHRLVSGLPELDSLSLYLAPCEITSASLVTLAKCCPRLTCCTLAAALNIRALKDHKEPLFPRLESMRIGGFTDPVIRGMDEAVDGVRRLVKSRAKTQARLLEKHFPQAYVFLAQNCESQYPDDAAFSYRVIRAYQSMWCKRVSTDDS